MCYRVAIVVQNTFSIFDVPLPSINKKENSKSKKTGRTWLQRCKIPPWIRYKFPGRSTCFHGDSIRCRQLARQSSSGHDRYVTMYVWVVNEDGGGDEGRVADRDTGVLDGRGARGATEARQEQRDMNMYAPGGSRALRYEHYRAYSCAF